MITRAQTVTILFTDLVGSTELLQRAGDEQAQRIFKAHHRLLREAVEAHGGHEVKWLGDGLMVAFDSTVDAVKCAIAMQQASRRPTAGERLEIRAGLNVGEAFVDESDYFGTSVVIARRLCDSGGAGAIRASDIVVRLLDGRGGEIRTKDLGPLELKGITNPVPAVEIIYEHDPMALLRKLPFVGRHDEYEAMLKKLGEARNGRGSVVLLAGEPGIGKTRLAEEFCDHASSVATVIHGNCYEGDVAAPFGPWVEALRSLIEQTPDASLRETLGPGGPDIAVLMPEVRRRLPDLEESLKLDPESERARLFESIGAFLRNAAEKKPLVIFLDDLHWCDRPSLALLEQVARGCGGKRIVIVGTYRDVEVDIAHPLAQTLSALRRMEHHERFAIRGFTEDAVYELLHAIEPSAQAEAATRGLAHLLFSECEGNPFFIREVLNNLIETGKLAQQGGVWTGTVVSIDELGIPAGIKEVIGRRLSRLSGGCNRMLQLASVLGGRFSWDQLRTVVSSGVDAANEDQLLNWLDEALGAQLLSEQNRLTYSFTHSLIAATLYSALSGPRRALIHRRVGEALEHLYVNDLDAHASELAHHFYQAALGGDADKAIVYSRRAARVATRQYAWEEAARLYERALDIAELVPAFDDATRIDVLLDLAEARLVVGGDEAHRQEIAGRAVEVARARGDGQRLGRAALIWAGPHREDNITHHSVISILEEAVTAVGSDDTPIRATLLARLQAALFYLPGSRERRLALHEEALEIARRVGDTDALLYALRLGVWLWDAGNAEAQIAMGREMLAIARDAGNESMAMDAHATLVGPLLEVGDRDGADAAIEAHAETQRKVRRAGWTSTWRAMLASMEGRLRDVPPLIREGIRELQQMNPENAINAANTQTWNYRRLGGHVGDLEAATESESRRFPEMPSYVAALAVASLAAGHDDQAREHFEELAHHGLASYAFDRTWTLFMAYSADACVGLGDEARARELYELIEPYQELSVITSHSCIAVDYAGTLHLRLANLATTMKRWSDAERHYEAAMERDRRMRAHAWLARTQRDYGGMLLARSDPGDREKARGLLVAARSFATNAGMDDVSADSARLLGTLK